MDIAPAPTIPTQPTAAQLNARNTAIGAPATPTGAYTGGGQNGPSYSPDVPVAAPSKLPPSEPTVLASGNITDNVIPNNHDTLSSLSNKGSVQGEDGNVYHTDGTVSPAGSTPAATLPSGATDNNDGTYSLNGIKYAQTNDPSEQAINDNIATLKSNLDSGTKAQIDSIEQQYTALKQMQGVINGSANDARRAATLTGGTERYSPDTATSIMSSQMSYGLSLIAKLDADENAAIARAKSAQQSGNMKIMDSAIKEAQSIRSAKDKAATKLQAQVSKAHDAVLKKVQQATLDKNISDLYSSGVTDPKDILSALTDAGVTASAADIAKTIKALNPKDSATDKFKFTNAQTSKLLALGLSSDQIQALHDYYNGKGDVSALDNLSTHQQNTVHDILNGKAAATTGTKTKSYTSGSKTYTPDDLGKAQKWLSDTKGTDGYVNPDAYKQAFDAWVSDGGLPQDFTKNFPPKTYINPANTQLPSYLRSKTTTSSGGSSGAVTDAQINSLFAK